MEWPEFFIQSFFIRLSGKDFIYPDAQDEYMRRSFCGILILCILLAFCGCSAPGTAPAGKQGNETDIQNSGTVTETAAAMYEENRSGIVPE